MTCRERVIAAINHKATDKIPHNIDFTQRAYEQYAAYSNNRNIGQRFDNHIKVKHYQGVIKEIKPGHFMDEFSVVWNKSKADKDIGVIDDILIPEPSLDGYAFPEVEEAKWRRELKELTENHEDKFVIAGLGFSLFERAWTLCGMENLLIYMISDPGFVDELLGRICEYNLKVIDIALEYPIDGMIFGDDWGQQRGLIMGPVSWRRFIKPQLAKMYKRLKDKGKYVCQHSCGDIELVFPDLIEIGLDVYQTFQPEIYDIVKVKEAYGDKLAFWGGISTQHLLPYETAETVFNEVRRISKIMGKNGGYIAAPTHDITLDVPPENIDAMLIAFKGMA